jgi:hypothetical protein
MDTTNNGCVVCLVLNCACGKVGSVLWATAVRIICIMREFKSTCRGQREESKPGKKNFNATRLFVCLIIQARWHSTFKLAPLEIKSITSFTAVQPLESCAKNSARRTCRAWYSCVPPRAADWQSICSARTLSRHRLWVHFPLSRLVGTRSPYSRTRKNLRN